MAIKVTEWKFSDETEAERIPVLEGSRYLLINDASYTEGEEVYSINFQDLQNDARFSVKYWLNTSDKNGNIVPNSAARGTLISLHHAALGQNKGLPYPADIIGAVVCGEVVLKDYNGKAFPKIYKYKPVNMDWAVLGFIEEQYVEETAEEPAADSEEEY